MRTLFCWQFVKVYSHNISGVFESSESFLRQKLKLERICAVTLFASDNIVKIILLLNTYLLVTEVYPYLFLSKLKENTTCTKDNTEIQYI